MTENRLIITYTCVFRFIFIVYYFISKLYGGDSGRMGVYVDCVHIIHTHIYHEIFLFVTTFKYLLLNFYLFICV